MTGTYVYLHFGSIISSFLKLNLNGGINVLNRLFIDGRWNDPVYRERTWLRTLRRIFRRS